MSPLPVDLIRTLSLMLVVTTLLVVETRQLRLATSAYVAQALIIVALLASFGVANHALFWWAGTALITKAILIPWFLYRYIRRTHDIEVPPLVGFAPSVLFAVLLMLGFYSLMHRQVDVLTHASLAGEEAFRTNVAVASTVFVLGLYALLTRRDAVKMVIGLCLLENGVHLGLVSLAPAIPETALFGVATEVVVTVFLLLYVIEGVSREFGTTDTFLLRELQW